MRNVKSGEQGRQGCLLVVTLGEALSDGDANEMGCHSLHLWGQSHLAERPNHTSLNENIYKKHSQVSLGRRQCPGEQRGSQDPLTWEKGQCPEAQRNHTTSWLRNHLVAE